MSRQVTARGRVHAGKSSCDIHVALYNNSGERIFHDVYTSFKGASVSEKAEAKAAFQSWKSYSRCSGWEEAVYASVYLEGEGLSGEVRVFDRKLKEVGYREVECRDNSGGLSSCLAVGSARRSLAAGSGDKLIVAYSIRPDGSIGYAGYIASIASAAKMDTLQDKNKGIGCTTQLRLARRYTEEKARAAIDFIRSIGAFSNTSLDVVSLAGEEQRNADKEDVDNQISALFKEWREGKISSEEYDTRYRELRTRYLELGFYGPALRDGYSVTTYVASGSGKIERIKVGK